ncbi:hypothetical protein [Dialister sp. i34-0019-2H8]|uniref:glycine-rich domain-containing protein n=1 Tax=Dialister sp. i34-0019-2H8 TaxID=3141190 RepID=UPI0034C028CD
MKETIYLMQSSFATGEVSPEVASRIDMEKYQAALMQAENCYIRPYGAVYKRPGSIYCGMAKKNKVRLIEFKSTVNHAFLLEVGEGYIRIWKDGKFTNQEIVTPYQESELPKLRTCQSADIMYIASGTHPVMQLKHYSDIDWRFEEMVMNSQYFDESLTVSNNVVDQIWNKAGTYAWECHKTGNYAVTVAGGGGGGANTVSHYRDSRHKEDGSMVAAAGGIGGNGAAVSQTVYLKENTTYTITVGDGGGKGSPGNSGGNSTAFGLTAQGGGGGQLGTFTGQARVTGRPHKHYTVYTGHAGEAGISYGNGGQGSHNKGNPGWVAVKSMDEPTLTVSGISGEVTLSSDKSFFSSDMKGMWIKISQDIASKSVTASGAMTTDPIPVGNGWKIITHGTWTGQVVIQKSTNGGEWKDFRTYKSNDDNNVSESGTVDEADNVRMRLVTTAGKADLTSTAYTKSGIIQIETVNSATSATCLVKKVIGQAGKVDSYSFGAWNEKYGYPRTVGFFQDRLIFAGTKTQPYVLWMSKTGDYNNFSVEKASGTVTDDSAICLSFISRQQAEIKHICPASDLFVLTDSNEWIVSGGSTVTPSKCTNKAQTFRGCTEVEPISIGSRLIYVQKRSQTVRDMAYSFETDSYDGMDLTLLAKHLLRGKTIVDAAYMQDPDSRLYFVRSDGEIICLAYINEQKVYAWSHIITKGKYLSVCTVAAEETDEVYTAVERNGKTYIEKMETDKDSQDPKDYIMTDCSKVLTFDEPDDAASVDWITGTVSVLADGKFFEDVEIKEGTVTLPTKVSYMIIGYPYRMTIELPNVEIQAQNGTMQGRYKNVRTVSLRLLHTLGGSIGNGVGRNDTIKYEELSDQKIRLYTGDKEITIPNQGVEKNGRVIITSSDPYPFYLAALIRGVIVSE